jgi:hypothetical protein
MKPKEYVIFAYQHLRWPNDTNGNPRRLYLVYDENASLLAVIDEGYRGLPKGLHGIPQLPTMELNAGYREYKNLTAPLSRKDFL